MPDVAILIHQVNVGQKAGLGESGANDPGIVAVNKQAKGKQEAGQEVPPLERGPLAFREGFNRHDGYDGCRRMEECLSLQNGWSEIQIKQVAHMI